MSLKRIFIKLISLLPLRYIVFESAPDFSDNSRAVFEEMLRRELHKKYKIIWVCYGEEALTSQWRAVRFFHYKKSRSDYWRLWYYLQRSKCVICSNRFLLSQNPKTLNVFLDHGSPLKNTKGYYHIPDQYDVINCASEAMKQLKQKLYRRDEARLTAWGHARNDVLLEPPMDLHAYFQAEFEKIIVWYPTFRQHKTSEAAITASSHAFPVIWDEEKALEINAFAKRLGILIVLKPHFAQDVSRIKALSLSNLVFIDDSFFKDNDIASYRFVGSCDALITDYSSIYYDYTLCDKPIGLTWEDYAQYAENPGFAVDMDYVMQGGVKIYTVEDFKAFLEDVAQGRDRLQKERREIRDFANAFSDGKSTQRAVDEMIKRAKL